MDDVELDNERHRQEEQERRAKRKEKRKTKSTSGQLTEKERKRREHAQRILGAQRGKKPSSTESKPTSSEGGSSIFQSLFQERAEGFSIDLRFRNAPPRPPVGPTFVGLGLEGELTNKWTKYKARNAVETQYTWKLHAERESGGQLAVSAMDYEKCYTANKDDVQQGNSNENLHPDDYALINWKGSLGDTAAEQLQQKQDRARAAARLAITQGYGAMPFKAPNDTPNTANSGGGTVRLKKHHLKSRILDEKTPNFMKKTTYLTNDATSVHRFTSLAHTQAQRARDVDQALKETKTKYSEMDMIEMGFKEANKDTTGKKRTHPFKKDVHALCDLPLLPDVSTWGHTYTHVVLDNPPKNVTASKNLTNDKSQAQGVAFKAKQLCKAVVADVTKQAQNARMECTLWALNSDSSVPPAKKLKRGPMYTAVQKYDLDVVPLRDPSVPPVHYVWVFDPSKDSIGYHCIGSRVHLSTGRPATEMATDKSYISRRGLEAEEKKNLEMRTAEVDVDLEEKYGLGQEDDELEEEETNEKKSEEVEGDAF